MEDNREVYDFYEAGAEIGRLERGLGKIEAARTKELLERFLVPGSAVCDVGGGPGYYSDWLARRGCQVTLVELAPAAVDYAKSRQSIPYRAEVGDARDLSMIVEPGSMDALLLMGPLYHLLEREERLRALGEAYRILKPGGLLAASGISKYSSATWALSTYGAANEFLDDAVYFQMLEGELTTGEHHRPEKYPGFLARAYFHEPKELAGELQEAGFLGEGLYAVEGCIWFTPCLQEKWGAPESRERLLALLRMTEQKESLLGMSPHFLAFGRKAESPEN